MTHPEYDEERESLVRWIADKAQAFAEDKPVATFPVAEVRKRIAAHTAKAVKAARAETARSLYDAVKPKERKSDAPVREILEFVWSLSPHNKNRMAEAEQALYDAMLALVGKDEPRCGHSRQCDIEREGRNNLRAEQRKALNALFGKKGKTE